MATETIEANIALRPEDAALGAMALVDDLIGTLRRKGVLNSFEIAGIFDNVLGKMPPTGQEGLVAILTYQADLAKRHATTN